MTTPIAIFAFNRPDHLARTMSHLAACHGASQRQVTIFIDGPRHDRDRVGVDAVLALAAQVRGFASVRTVARERNHGCAASVIAGVSECMRDAERLIVIEDDILCHPGTLRFLDRALDRYQDRRAAFSISAWAPPPRLAPPDPGYPYGTYFAPRFHCWGWATWRDRWALGDWGATGHQEMLSQPAVRRAYARGGGDLPDMIRRQMSREIDSWAVRMDYTRFRHGGLTLYPVRSFTTNIGFDGTGLHCGAQDPYANDIALADPEPSMPEHVFVDEAMAGALRRAYDPPPPPTFRQRAVGRIRRLLGSG
jgi:hypothetical protein